MLGQDLLAAPAPFLYELVLINIVGLKGSLHLGHKLLLSFLVLFLFAFALVPVAVAFPASVMAPCIPIKIVASMVAIPVVPWSVPPILPAPLWHISAVACCSAVRSLPDIMAASVITSVQPGGLRLPIRVAYLSVRAGVM